jgi:hypothetical protein
MAKDVTFYEVSYTEDRDSEMGDGFFTERFKKLPDAERFAAGRQCWSAPAKPELVTLPKRIASRYAIR